MSGETDRAALVLTNAAEAFSTDLDGVLGMTGSMQFNPAAILTRMVDELRTAVQQAGEQPHRTLVRRLEQFERVIADILERQEALRAAVSEANLIGSALVNEVEQVARSL